MEISEIQDRISELRTFFENLRKYKTRILKRQETKYTDAQERSLDAMRLNLQREYGRLAEVLVKYGDSIRVTNRITGTSQELFQYCLVSLDLGLGGNSALDQAIGLVNKAIGGLEATTIESDSSNIKSVKPNAEVTKAQELETFLQSLIEYCNALPTIQSGKATRMQINAVASLRGKLIEVSGKHKDLIAELTGVPGILTESTDSKTQTDRWLFALKVNRDVSSIKALLGCIDITRQGIGKLKSDIDQGIRDKTGNLTKRTIESRDHWEVIENICNHFSTVVGQIRDRHDSRPTLEINDEYDVQDLLHALLRLYFSDIRREEWTPSYAGGSSRMDILLKTEQIVIEVKKTRYNLKDKQIGDQLSIDIVRYKEHPDCKTLVCFVFDPERKIGNPRGLENDLAKFSSSHLQVRLFIRS